MLTPDRFSLTVASLRGYIVIINTGKHFSQNNLTGGADCGFSRNKDEDSR
jgi:hypothetical protein